MPPLRDGRVLWLGDPDSGELSQFDQGDADAVGGSPAQVVTDPARDGKYAVALTIPGASTVPGAVCCSARTELLPRFRDIVPGDSLYFGFSVLLEPGFPVAARWQSIFQLKQNFDGSPAVGLFIEDGKFRLQGGYDHPGGSQLFDLPLQPAVTGQWVDLVVHVVFSPDPAVGYLDAWAGGQQVVDHYMPKTGTMYHNPTKPDASGVKFGYYRNPTIPTPGTIVFDDMRIGTTFGSVRHLDTAS